MIPVLNITQTKTTPYSVSKPDKGQSETEQMQANRLQNRPTEDVMPVDDVAETPSSKAHILIVDDDFSNREMMVAALSSHYDVVAVRNGPEALAQLTQSTFDLVLLDIMMPGMDGLQVLQRIRQDASLYDLPVILLSALSDSEYVIKGLRYGANDYINKTELISVILARVEKQIQAKRLADERKTALERLQVVDSIRTQFAHIASHDLGNILNNIMLAERELRYRYDDELTQNNLDTIREASSTMRSIIRDFLDMVNLRSGQIDLKLARVNLIEVLMSVLSQYELALANKRINLTIGDTGGAVYGDYDRIIQALANLVSNAIKYSPLDADIVVDVVQVRPGYLRIRVTDSGPGIPEAERDSLFQAFSKISTQTTAGEGSTGLGLWIVRHLMTLQGGDAGASFPQAGGSQFWMELPEFTDDEPASYHNPI